MKIRNLQDYIYDRCGCKDSLKYLFTDDEPFFKTVAGGAQLRNRVSSCASLAKDAEQQVFYEFVQNALMLRQILYSSIWARLMNKIIF